MLADQKKNDPRFNPLSISLYFPKPKTSQETEYASDAVVRVQKSCPANVPQPKLMHLHNIWGGAERKRAASGWVTRPIFLGVCDDPFSAERVCMQLAPSRPSSQNRPLTLIHLATQIELVSSRRTTIHRPLSASRGAHSNPCSEPINIGAVEDYVCENSFRLDSRAHNQPVWAATRVEMEREAPILCAETN